MYGIDIALTCFMDRNRTKTVQRDGVFDRSHRLVGRNQTNLIYSIENIGCKAHIGCIYCRKGHFALLTEGHFEFIVRNILPIHAAHVWNIHTKPVFFIEPVESVGAFDVHIESQISGKTFRKDTCLFIAAKRRTISS